MTTRRPGLAGLAVLLLAGCTGELTNADEQCAASEDCPEGYICIGSKCRKLCLGSRECPNPDQECREGYCIEVASAECHQHTDCASPTICEVPEDAICYEGRCYYEPMLCPDPPASECFDNDSWFRSYATIGVCAPETGTCFYPSFEMPCAQCSSACLPVCDGVVCDDVNGGCKSSGHCQPGVADDCLYLTASNGVACDRPESAVGTYDGVCIDGYCSRIGDETCSTNERCVPDTCIAGHCRPFSQAGQPCDSSDHVDCDDDLTCLGNTCLLNDGQPCQSNLMCVSTCLAGTCSPRSAGGAICDFEDNADCLTNLACAEGVCRLVNGQLCASNSECVGTCISSLCSSLADVLASCDLGDDGDCRAGHLCDGGVCRKVADQTCASNDECLGTCIGGSCASPSGLNGPCDSGDDGDCSASLSCTDSVCKTSGGQACTQNDECTETCIGEVCQFFSEATGPCDTDDHADCQVTLMCHQNSCLKVDDALCTGNEMCINTCIGGVCRPLSAVTGTCDPGDNFDCGTGLTCFGGSCLLANLQPCGNNNECVNTCVAAICRDQSGTGGVCDSNDHGDCAVDLVCDGIVCRKQNGIACGANTECANTCVNGFCVDHAGLDGICDPGDSADCAANLECAGAQCKRIVGESCGSDAECGLGHCECADVGCVTRVCATADCECRYGTNGLCSFFLTDGVDDVGDCVGTTQSCYNGSCRSDTYGWCECLCSGTETTCGVTLSTSTCHTGRTAVCRTGACEWYCGKSCYCSTLVAPECDCL